MAPTYPTAPPGNTLADIQTKVRRLTRSPSEAQLTTDDLNNYINTFVIYDFPEHLRTFNLRKQFTFTCNPFQDVYPTNIFGFGGVASADVNELYNFQNKYLTIHPPVYIAGYQSFFTQSREQFYGIYPMVNNIQSISHFGDGTTTNFSGFINMLNNPFPPIPTPSPNGQGGAVLVKGEVLFSSVDTNGNGLALVDVPCLDSDTGNPTQWGQLYNPNSQAYINATKNTVGVAPAPVILTAPYNTLAKATTGINDGKLSPTNFINYITGQFSLIFPVAPFGGAAINSQSVPSIVSIPQALLWYQDQFVLRPIPDQPYDINFEVYVRPTQLFLEGSVPALEEYWQYIAYGSCIKIFQDRMDLDSVQLVMPEFKTQERLVLRRTLVQHTNERTATIYTEQVGNTGYTGGWGSGGGLF
jgi:hypothetical protein